MPLRCLPTSGLSLPIAFGNGTESQEAECSIIDCPHLELVTAIHDEGNNGLIICDTWKL
jgi:hypothetical protein